MFHNTTTIRYGCISSDTMYSFVTSFTNRSVKCSSLKCTFKKKQVSSNKQIGTQQFQVYWGWSFLVILLLNYILLLPFQHVTGYLTKLQST